MAEGVLVQHFITCEEMSQVDKITPTYSVLSGIKFNKSIDSYVKNFKIKVIPTQKLYVRSLCMDYSQFFFLIAGTPIFSINVSLVQLKVSRKSCQFK